MKNHYQLQLEKAKRERDQAKYELEKLRAENLETEKELQKFINKCNMFGIYIDHTKTKYNYIDISLN